jgi:CBS domain containing-hemolysin-like protein
MDVCRLHFADRSEMTSTLVWIVLLILLDMAFSILRAALVHTRLPYLMNLHEKDPAGTDRAVRLLESNTLRVTIYCLGALIHFSLAGLGIYLLTVGLSQKIGSGISIVELLLAVLFVLVLEFMVEGWIEPVSEEWAIRVAPVGLTLDNLFRPLAWLLKRVQFPPGKSPRSRGAVTEDELKNWVEEGQVEGSLKQGEREMIYSIFHFSETLCREIMVPRIDVFSLEADISLEEAVRQLTASGHSRVPVYDDVIDNILGVVYAKDLLSARLDDDQNKTVRSLMRPAYFVPEAKHVGELLKEMQAHGVHIAIVIDEYGGMAGLVTLEDIVEEIVGEIRDEYDQSEEQLYVELGTDDYSFQGRIDLDDLNEILGTHLTKEIADTLGGWIYGEIGRIPVEGEKVRLVDWELTVEKVTFRRIRRVRAQKLDHETEVEVNNGIER